jgi:phosphatidate cytidylyltransferase
VLYLRVLTALVGIPLILFLVWQGGLLLLAFIGLVMILGVLEMTNLLQNLKLTPNVPLTICGLMLLLGVVYLNEPHWVGLTLTMILLTHLLLMLKNYPHYTPADGAAGLFITLYLGLLIYLYLISLLPQGHHWLFMLLIGTWASDTMAYFFGRTFGKHKLTPVLSPKKTWEGAIAGLLGSVVAVYIYSIVFKPIVSMSVLTIILLGLLISISSQVGDLIESTLKRQAKIKDSGNIIPGHGGVLDRFDSMLLSAPMVYYFVLVFIM